MELVLSLIITMEYLYMVSRLFGMSVYRRGACIKRRFVERRLFSEQASVQEKLLWALVTARGS